jgi:hypothetical protein
VHFGENALLEDAALVQNSDGENAVYRTDPTAV